MLRVILTWLGDWRRFCALAVALYLARAAFVLSVLPPFEGWDEYQHVAYAVHLAERGSPPAQDEAAVVPRSLYAALVSYPLPKLAVDQIGSIGAMEYGAYWKRLEADEPIGEVRAAAPDVALYQAQHPPLYYQIIAPLLRGRLSPEAIVPAIMRVRLIGVACGAAALVVFALALERLVRPGPGRHLMLLAVATQPLMLLNSARVASDGLAVLLGTLAVVMVLEFRIERWRRHGLILGAALGLAVLAKAYNLLLAPFIVLVWLDRLRRGRWRLVQASASALLTFAVAAILTGDYFADSFRRYGVLTPMQESVVNARAGVGSAELLREALSPAWLAELSRKYLRQTLFVGGWSYLKTFSAAAWLYQACLMGAAVAGLLALHGRRREEGRLFAQRGTAPALAMLGLCFAAGLVWHMVSARRAWGSITTNVWYAAVSFPWLLCLYVQAAAYVGRRAGLIALGGGLIVLHGAAETWGVLGEMAPRYAAAAWGPLARERLAALHPAWLGPGWTIPAMAASSVLLWLGLIAALGRVATGPDESGGVRGR